ncbi:hypothetical protein C3L50_08830 [Flavobacterium alvei]|uniref:DUF4178 domain-containing protein n=1 Tax=Flavobacterium alvei TaxID=2080416 RepID=A0A2S5ABI7_9FLAO|nr:DUF4178 domain-containing protein [Flavobacterium alvei]POY39925.1 hypothetical protein C3L50_08830 [Flavobacterium alvei]
MTVPCYNCNTSTTLEVHFEVSTFACPNCTSVYRNTEVGLKFYKKREAYSFDEKFELGKTATFDGKEYKVTGILIKENQGFEWTEYILEAKQNDYIYLSEAAGHWIILTEIPFDQKVGNHPLTVEYEEIIYDRFDYYYPSLVAAQGFFDFDVFDKFELIEFINPPLMLSFEKMGRQQTAFLGKHISKSDIKKAFGTSNLPSKKGIGQVQPFIFNIRNLAITFCVVALLILLTNWYLNKDRVEQNVLNTEFPFEQYTTKDYVTPSFELKGSAAPLSIRVHSEVDNSWANVQIALINETTGEEIYANKDIEYYHGYTDGENWTEGNTTEEFNICGVAAGKYHLTITPMKATEDFQNQKIQIQANWSSPSSRNVWMVYIFMTVFVIGMYYLEKNFEQKRWNE